MCYVFPKYFLKGDLPSDNLSIGNFLNKQFSMRQLPKGQVRPSEALHAATGGQALRLGLTWEVAAWETAHMGSCHLVNYPWEVAIWEQSFRKVPNIVQYTMDGKAGGYTGLIKAGGYT